MAARLTGTLAQAEGAAAGMEQAGDQPPKWRKLHPARHFSGRARRWVMRRVLGVRALLKTLVRLYPERFGAAAPTLAVLPAPVGFLRRPPNSVAKAGPGRVQHNTARSPPRAAGGGLAD